MLVVERRAAMVSMNATGIVNTMGLSLSLALGWLALATVPVGTQAVVKNGGDTFVLTTLTLADGRSAVADMRGTPIPLGDYRRIASLGIQSDALLVELCEPNRLACACAWSVGPWTHRLGSLPRLRALDDLESIIALKPDLVLVSTFGGDLDRIARLREAGLTVCDLGPQGGVASLQANARLLGRLLNEPRRAELFLTAFQRRFAAVAAHLPAEPRRSAVYVQCIGDNLFGGSAGTSFHDVLTAAGLTDISVPRYRAWPQYTVEQLIDLNPDFLVTQRGSAERLRRLPGIASMRAAQVAGGIIELDIELLQCPGPVMLDAAEALHAAVFSGVR